MTWYSLNLLNRCGGTGGYPRGETPAARASPPDWSRRGEGGSFGQWGWVSENAGMKAICLMYYIHTTSAPAHSQLLYKK